MTATTVETTTTCTTALTITAPTARRDGDMATARRLSNALASLASHRIAALEAFEDGQTNAHHIARQIITAQSELRAVVFYTESDAEFAVTGDQPLFIGFQRKPSATVSDSVADQSLCQQIATALQANGFRPRIVRDCGMVLGVEVDVTGAALPVGTHGTYDAASRRLTLALIPA